MRNSAFTLVEIIVVVIIIAILATIGLMNFDKFLQRGRERDAVSQLRAIATALKVYEMRAKVFPDAGDAGTLMNNRANINSTLFLSIMEHGMTYSCADVGDLEYDCRATSDTHGWVLHVEQDGAGDVYDAHCFIGDCPTCDTTGHPGSPGAVDCY